MSLNLAILAVGALVAVPLVLTRPFAGLLLLVFLTPLDAVLNLLATHGAMISSPMKLLGVLVLAGVVVQSYSEPRSSRLGPNEVVFKWGALFILAMGLSLLFADDHALGLSIALRQLRVLLILYLMIRLVGTTRRVEALLLAIVVSTGISATVAVLDWLIGGNVLATSEAATSAQFAGISRSTGASDYDAAASAGMMCVGTTLALFLAARARAWQALTIPVALLGGAAIVLSFTRSAALVLSIGVLWLLYKMRHDRRLPLLLATMLLVGAASLPLIPSKWWERMGSLGTPEADGSLTRRIGYQLIGLDLLIASPVVGVGPGNFRHHYTDPEYRWIPGRVWHEKRLSNMYLEIACEYGLVGFACFAGILIAALHSVSQAVRSAQSARARMLAEAVQFTYVAYLLLCIFTLGQLHKYTWILTGLAVAAGRVAGFEGVVARAGGSPGPAADAEDSRGPRFGSDSPLPDRGGSL